MRVLTFMCRLNVDAINNEGGNSRILRHVRKPNAGVRRCCTYDCYISKPELGPIFLPSVYSHLITSNSISFLSRPPFSFSRFHNTYLSTRTSSVISTNSVSSRSPTTTNSSSIRELYPERNEVRDQIKYVLCSAEQRT